MHEKAKRKNISLKEKIDTENDIAKTKGQLAKIEKDIRLRNRVLKTVGYVVAGTALGGPAVNTIMSKLGINGR